MANLIAIKGSKDGLRLQLDELTDWPDVLEALRGQLGKGANFFHGAQITALRSPSAPACTVPRSRPQTTTVPPAMISPPALTSPSTVTWP
jgi:hypothetical protein